MDPPKKLKGLQKIYAGEQPSEDEHIEPKR
jgi:hypothetical protein